MEARELHYQLSVLRDVQQVYSGKTSSLFDLNHTVFTGGLIYIPNNPEIVHNIKIALEEELVKLRRKFENL